MKFTEPNVQLAVSGEIASAIVPPDGEVPLAVVTRDGVAVGAGGGVGVGPGVGRGVGSWNGPDDGVGVGSGFPLLTRTLNASDGPPFRKLTPMVHVDTTIGECQVGSVTTPLPSETRSTEVDPPNDPQLAVARICCPLDGVPLSSSVITRTKFRSASIWTERLGLVRYSIEGTLGTLMLNGNAENDGGSRRDVSMVQVPLFDGFHVGIVTSPLESDVPSNPLIAPYVPTPKLPHPVSVEKKTR